MSLTSNTLDDMCELIIDCPHFTPEWTTSGYLVIRNQNIRDGRLDLSERSYTHLEDFERRIRRAKPQAGDIIFTREAPMGEVCLVPEGLECCVGQRQVLLRPARNVDHRYLFYALRSPAVRHQILWNEGTGSTVSNVRIPILKAIKIPRLGEAEASIGEVLDNIDQKIELNRRMNETLEAMAQAIFRDWFVDFGPVRRKLEGATDPVAILGGLMPDPARAAEMAGLFPDGVGEDELPVGWKAGDFGDLATTAGESVDPTLLGEDTPYIGLEHMPRRSITLDSWDFAGKVSSQKSRFSSRQVLFGKLRPYFHKVGIAPVDGVCSTDIVVLDSRADFDRELVACCASSDAFVAFTDMTSTGTKMPRTSWSHMKTYELAIADAPVRRAFSGLVRPMHQKIVASVAENRTLAETRDYLLPRLMSGDIRVTDASREFAA
ncbi:restriction endonuclease subunit S [Brevundimonas sp.]|uniref:restriction endonuclease subunit S n=1 Tax=Brevundimonas sp. TaxID=1871086 RepID=UPI003A8D1E37